MSEVNAKPIKASHKFTAEVFDWIHIFFVAIVLAGLINTFCFQVIKIEQTSMVPSFYNGERVMLSKVALWFDEPKCGDIIVFYNENEDENLIKRVIGVPGDTIEIINQKVYRNGVELDEPYINEPTNGSFSVTVPEGRYFCLGDNRNVSQDSRNPLIGCVRLEDILGKVIFRFEGLQTVSSYDHSYSDNIE